MRKTAFLGIIGLLALSMIATGALAKGFGEGHGISDQARLAVEANDFDAWMDARPYYEEGCPHADENMLRARFNEVVQWHNEREAWREARHAERPGSGNGRKLGGRL